MEFFRVWFLRKSRSIAAIALRLMDTLQSPTYQCNELSLVDKQVSYEIARV